MKKSRKVGLIISGILAVVGIILISVGVFMGGISAVAGDVLDGRLSVVIGDDFFSDIDMEDMDNIADGENLFKDEINSITLDGKYGDYEICVWDKEEYGIQGTKGEDKIKYSIENGNLKLSVKKKYVIHKETMFQQKFIYQGMQFYIMQNLI